MGRSLDEKKLSFESTRRSGFTNGGRQEGCKSLKSLQLHEENPAGGNLHDGTQRSMDDCGVDIVLGGQGGKVTGGTNLSETRSSEKLELQDDVQGATETHDLMAGTNAI